MQTDITVNTTAIHNLNEYIYKGLARDIADNGERGDAHQGLYLAPTTGGEVVLVHATNGYDAMVAWLGDGGEWELADEYRQQLADADTCPDDLRWMRETLLDKPAGGAVSGLD